MSITVETILHCEHDGCKNTHRVKDPKAAPRYARAYAKEQGWSRVAGKDYCKEHKPTYKRVLVPAS